jgi:hypothetical protein
LQQSAGTTAAASKTTTAATTGNNEIFNLPASGYDECANCCKYVDFIATNCDFGTAHGSNAAATGGSKPP